MKVMRPLLPLLLASVSSLAAQWPQECLQCKTVNDGGQLDGNYVLYMEDQALCPSGCIYTKEGDVVPGHYCFYPSEVTYTSPCVLRKEGESCGSCYCPPTYTAGECEPGLTCVYDPQIPDAAGICLKEDVCGDPACDLKCNPGEQCVSNPDIFCVQAPCCAQWSCVPTGLQCCTVDACHASGDSWPCEDGCNTCWCEDGIVVSTQMECPGSTTADPEIKTTKKPDPEIKTTKKPDPEIKTTRKPDPEIKTTKKPDPIVKPRNNATAAPAQQCKCGVKKMTRIVGGKETHVNEYLWMVSLQTPSRGHLCGASLIASQWVVTAAHCFYDGAGNRNINKPNQLEVVIGEHDLYEDGEELRKSLAISKILIHSDYDFSSNMKDITLLKLVHEVDLGVYTPVCLPEPNTDFTGKKAWVYGWGTLSSGGDSPDKLQELEVPIVADSTCQKAFKSKDRTITNEMLSVMVCAGGKDGEDACQGDSGGPLSHDNNGQHQLVGVVSWGIGCAMKGYFGLYAEVAVLRTWIDDTIANNGGAVYCK